MFESFLPKEELINEMVNAMQKNEKLTKMMYKFFCAIKF